MHHRNDIDENPVWVSVIDDVDKEENGYSRFENLIITSVLETMSRSNIDLTSKDTIFIFSTTKGNISLLEQNDFADNDQRKLSLFYSGEAVRRYFKNPNKSVVISNACISGVVALLFAARKLRTGKFKNAVVVGADTISKFVYSGFQSFQALSPGRCNPFSENRNGINLGEAAAAIILTTENHHNNTSAVKILSGAITNDSNHISGPSRTGKELSAAINKAIVTSGITSVDIDFICAHGTATPFNDEMEAKAFNLSGLQSTPVNSLKGYFGHTLGAAGIVESIISIMALHKGEMPPSMGFTGTSVQPKLNVANKVIKNESMRYCLKTASGFGGCNAAIVFSKS